jgi:hypothetical protein
MCWPIANLTERGKTFAIVIDEAQLIIAIVYHHRSWAMRPEPRVRM